MAKTGDGEGKDTTAVTALKQDSPSTAELSPPDEFKEDILVSLKQVLSGDVIDADQSLRDIRRELGIDDN